MPPRWIRQVSLCAGFRSGRNLLLTHTGQFETDCAQLKADRRLDGRRVMQGDDLLIAENPALPGDHPREIRVTNLPGTYSSKTGRA